MTVTCLHRIPYPTPCPACAAVLAAFPPYLASRTRVVAGGHWRWVGSFNRPVAAGGNGRPRCGFVWGGHNYTLAYQAYLAVAVGPALPGMVAAHVCRCLWCVRPAAQHVIWASAGCNGLHERGHRPGRPKLTVGQVQAVRLWVQLPDPPSVARMAAMLHVGPGTIAAILAGRSWKGVA